MRTKVPSTSLERGTMHRVVVSVAKLPFEENTMKVPSFRMAPALLVFGALAPSMSTSTAVGSRRRRWIRPRRKLQSAWPTLSADCGSSAWGSVGSDSI